MMILRGCCAAAMRHSPKASRSSGEMASPAAESRWRRNSRRSMVMACSYSTVIRIEVPDEVKSPKSKRDAAVDLSSNSVTVVVNRAVPAPPSSFIGARKTLTWLLQSAKIRTSTKEFTYELFEGEDMGSPCRDRGRG